jgi:tetratricopeptide (TPR) repeat protein
VAPFFLFLHFCLYFVSENRIKFQHSPVPGFVTKKKSTLIAAAQNSSQEFADRLLRAGELRRQGLLNEAAEEFDLIISIAQSTGDRKMEGRALNGRGIVEERRDNYPKAKEYYDRALAIANEIDDMIGAGLTLSDLAWIHQHWGMHEIATENARASLDALRGTSENHVALHRMGTLLADSGHYRSALDFFDQAIAAAIEIGDQLALGLNYGWSASMHLHLGDAALAKEINLKSLQLAEVLNDQINVANLTAKLGYCEMELGNLGCAQEQMCLASKLFLAQGRLSNLASCMMSLADLEVRLGNPAGALTTLESASKYLAESGSKRHEWRLHETYSKAYESMENWRMVVFHERERQRSRQERDSEEFRSSLHAAQVLLATERERHEAETHRLRVRYLEQSLVAQASSIVTQSELLERIREHVIEVFHEMHEPISALKKIREKLKDLPHQEIDWPKFEAQFSSAHPDFMAKLEKKYPDLTPQELRLCSLVRLGLKTPEISKLLSLSERTLENHRFNIRKKLALHTEQSLQEFLNKNV